MNKIKKEVITIIGKKIVRLDSIKKALLLAGINYKLGYFELKKLNEGKMLILGELSLPIMLYYPKAKKEIKKQYKEYLLSKENNRTIELQEKYNKITKKEQELEESEILILNKNLSIRSRFRGGLMKFARKYNLPYGTVKSYLSRGHKFNSTSGRSDLLYCYTRNYQQYVKNRK